MDNEYEYSQENRLEHPHTYMYTKYEGKAFFKEFFNSREKCIKLLGYKDKADILKQINNLLKSSTAKNPKEFIESIKKSDKINTREILRKTAFLFINNKELNLGSFYQLMRMFCKKFEVSKKIFSDYRNQFMILKKQEEANYKELENYALLSFCLLFFYDKSKNLKFLNAALKINDLLCSVIAQIKNEKELIGLLTQLDLIKEQHLIKALMEQKGVIL